MYYYITYNVLTDVSNNNRVAVTSKPNQKCLRLTNAIGM